jgi:hypothetical protein
VEGDKGGFSQAEDAWGLHPVRLAATTSRLTSRVCHIGPQHPLHSCCVSLQEVTCALTCCCTLMRRAAWAQMTPRCRLARRPCQEPLHPWECCPPTAYWLMLGHGAQMMGVHEAACQGVLLLAQWGLE